jgi:hypothetical protein
MDPPKIVTPPEAIAGKSGGEQITSYIHSIIGQLARLSTVIPEIFFTPFVSLLTAMLDRFRIRA